MKRLALLLLLATYPGLGSSATSLYVVKEDDTVTSILRSQGFGEAYAELLPFIEQIVALNPDSFRNGNANFILPGSTLTLPENPNTPQPEPEPPPDPEPFAEPEPEPEPVIQAIGQVRASAGRAEIVRGDETIEIGQRRELYANDVVFTGDRAAVEITLLDETRISMGPESEFAITEYAYTAPATPNDNALGMLVASIRNGAIRTITGLIGKLKSNRFEVTSSLSATIGIRGTDFTVRSCNQLEACGDLYGVAVAVQDGKISFGNQAAEIELNENEFAQVQSVSQPPAKAPLP
ncbi:MAG: FecR family protein, partial [Gammaproteobacteria bacterium]|nr:FecR family protein [Gammaproteobacteria bacterium]